MWFLSQSFHLSSARVAVVHLNGAPASTSFCSASRSLGPYTSTLKGSRVWSGDRATIPLPIYDLRYVRSMGVHTIECSYRKALTPIRSDNTTASIENV